MKSEVANFALLQAQIFHNFDVNHFERQLKSHKNYTLLYFIHLKIQLMF